MAKMKSTTLNTELLDKFFPTSIMVGANKVELRSYRETIGHDDSLPYQSKVFVNDKEVAVAYNDGWGGETNIQATKETAYPILREVEKYISDHKEEFPMGEYLGETLYHSNLGSICDVLADSCASRKDIQKHATKRMVIYNPTDKRLLTLSFKGTQGKKILDLLEIPAFRTLWNNAVARYEGEGKIVLNNEYTLLSVNKKVG